MKRFAKLRGIATLTTFADAGATWFRAGDTVDFYDLSFGYRRARVISIAHNTVVVRWERWYHRLFKRLTRVFARSRKR